MIKYLRDEKLQLFWFVFHALIGFASVQSKVVLIVWFYIVAISFVASLLTSREPSLDLICFLAYVLGIEVLARGIKAAPFIPYEIGKYLTFFGFLIGLAFRGPVKKISIYGMAMLLLSVPGILIAPYSFSNIVFNYLGPVGVFLGVIFCKRQIITYKQFKDLCRMMVYSIFTLACFTIFKASTFEKIEYTLLANYQTAGGSITNQVSILFGTAICILFLMFVTGQRLFKYAWMDVSLLLLFMMRGLLTFSRGGMVSAALTLFLILVLPKAKNAFKDSEVQIRKISFLPILLTFAFVAVSFFVINSVTNNYLLYRYQGKTERSLQTGFDTKNDLDHMSAGRYSVMMSDFRMFATYPALGVGVGQSSTLRPLYGGEAGVISHLEFSRLLAEHGILGLIIIIMMYLLPFAIMFVEQDYYKRIIMITFIVMGLSATFHNAMRTMITPILFALSFLNIVPSSYNWKEALDAKKKPVS